MSVGGMTKRWFLALVARRPGAVRPPAPRGTVESSFRENEA